MSVLYLSYDGAMDPLGQSQVVPYVKGLASLGYPMKLVSFEKPGGLRDAKRVSSVRQDLEEAGVEWSPLRYHRRWSLASTSYDVLQGIRVGLRIHRSSDVKLIHARSYVAGLMAREIAARTSAPWIFDMRGFWVDERIGAGLWTDGSPVVRLARALERSLLARADALVHLTEQGARLAPELAPGVTLPRAFVIPTCVDLGRFTPADDPEALRRRLGIERGPVILYIGSLSTWYLAELTLRVGGAFVRRTGGSFVVLTQEVEYVRDLADKLGVDPRVETVEYGRVPDWIRMADAGLALVRPDHAKRASAPTKVGEYLACGLAVAATAGVGDLNDHFQGSDVALTVSPSEEPEKIVDGILAAMGTTDRVAKARALAEAHYDLAAAVGKFAELYRSLGVELGESGGGA